jgi:hypothetical protein
VVKTDNGYTLIIVLELKKLINQVKAKFPEGYRFKIHAYNLLNPDSEFVRIDNHNGKSSHYHLDNKEVFFNWIS